MRREGKERPLLDGEVYTFREQCGLDDNGNPLFVWVACWRRRDIVSQGDTEAHATQALIEAVGLNWMIQEMGEGRYEPVPSPPPRVLSDWQSRHELEHAVRSAAGEGPPSKTALEPALGQQERSELVTRPRPLAVRHRHVSARDNRPRHDREPSRPVVGRFALAVAGWEAHGDRVQGLDAGVGVVVGQGADG